MDHLFSDGLSNGDNESVNEDKDDFPTSRRSCILNSRKNPLWSSKITSLMGSETSSKNIVDIDVDYAIVMLKKDDRNMNVYGHMRRILDKILSERPNNPLENFEKFSHLVKRTYVNEEVHFEQVFVDDINRNACKNNLQMYKCAMKKLSENKKIYLNNNNNNTNTSDKNSVILKTENKTNVKCINDYNDVEVQVQNIWEANYMFNKAGCGLPADEVALISLTMNQMALLKKFKNIRFVTYCFYFGLKLWTKNVNAKLTSNIKRKSKDTNSAAIKTSDPYNVKFVNSMIKKEALEELQQNLIESTCTSVEDQLINNSLNSEDFFPFSSNGSISKLETLSEIIPSETFGIGVNKNVYFVANDLNSKWFELESVQPKQIIQARKIKRFFIGKLFDPVISYPKFEGLEKDYLRAQIARISASTQICPRGYLVIKSKETIQCETQDHLSISSSDSTTRNHFDLILNKSFKSIPNNDLIKSMFWVHANPQIQNNGVTNYFDFSVLSQTITNNQNIGEDEMFLIEDEENYSYNERLIHFKEELFGNLRDDVTINQMAGWKGALCSPFDLRYSFVSMKSHIWPGAYAVAYKLKTEYVYMGWAQKQDFVLCTSPSMINELKFKKNTEENPIEDQDPAEDLGMTKSKSNKKKR